MTKNLTKLAIITSTFFNSVITGQHRAWIDEVWEALRDWRRELGIE